MKILAGAPSVIIADNNEFYRRVVGDFYLELGYEIRVASDGIEALGMIKQKRPDLLVLDLIMPRFDGARLSSFLKSQEAYRDIPIIILSGILADEIDGVEEIRADAYIAKMPLEQIRTMLREVSEKLVSGGGQARPILSGFDKMYRREVVLELLQERRASQITLDSLSEGIAELSSDRRILVSNRAFQQITGRPLGTMIARPLEEVLPEGRPLLLSMFEEVDRGAPAATGVIKFEQRELQINLHRIESSVDPSDGLPADPADDVALPGGIRSAVRRAARTTPKVKLEAMLNSVSYTVLVEDITQRANAERDRETLRSRLAQSQRMSAIGLFVAGAAHELNNPLTSVLGYSQLLLQRHQASEIRGELERIAAGASRCKTILENLMAFARSNRPAKSLIDFNALIVESLSSYADRLRQAKIEVILELAPTLPSTLADPLQIIQAFGCVIDNALKALSDSRSARSLVISSKAVAETIVVEFIDDGPGIPEEILGKVFEPFFTTRQVGQGAGLGLSVAYGMVAAHAGRISLRNRPDGGASVRLEFPITLDEKESSAGFPRAMTPDQVAPPVSRRILIVDDETVVQDLLVDMLKNDRDLIDTASNGHEGLLKIGGHEYDLIILDLRMPDMTGQQMYEELARLRPDLLGRLMFITADTLTPEVARFLKSVGNPCLTKPFALDAVKERVETILGGAGH